MLAAYVSCLPRKSKCNSFFQNKKQVVLFAHLTKKKVVLFVGLNLISNMFLINIWYIYLTSYMYILYCAHINMQYLNDISSSHVQKGKKAKQYQEKKIYDVS